MKIYDITIPVHPDMPVWPGDSGVSIERVRKIEAGDNANVSHLSLGAHTGTHVDAPCHFIPGGITLDQVPLDRFIGEAEVVEIPNVDRISAADLEKAELKTDAKRVLFKTRNSQIWARGENRFQEDFTALNPDAAQYLVDRGVAFVGIDYLSIAPFKESRPTHEILLSAGVVILEGVDLSEVPAGRYTLFCLPLKLDGVDGAPARAILVGE
jgi:arylformamidase